MYKPITIYLITLTLLIFSDTPKLYCQPIENGYTFNKDSLNKLNSELRNGDYGKISSVLVLYKSKILFEQYYGFNNANSLHPISSVTKSVTSLITGICLDKGFIESIDTPIGKYFPEYKSVFEKDTIKKRITIRNLLNQTTGMRWDEWTTHYSYAGNSLIDLSQSNMNWVEATLKLDVECFPSTKFCYNSGNSQVIAEILYRATGHDLEWLVANFLFNPLGIKTYHWDSYPNNGVPAWGGISLSTRDMARIGTLICNHGRVNNLQVVSKEWIEKSISMESKNGKADYGLHWWVSKQPDGKPLIYAAGYGDQYVYILPDKRVVIAINGQNFTDYKWTKSIDELIKSIYSSIE
ncbi:MAG: class A beta-lactamase-related serine hydrolase [Bacteroidales bacterium]|nr:MAG: class A beta-lactamase-related serine hydrolase [Bacteroidales bacterium]